MEAGLEGNLYHDWRPKARDKHVVIVGQSFYCRTFDRPELILYVGIGLPSGKMLHIHPQRLLKGAGFRFVTHFTTLEALEANPRGYVTVAVAWLKKKGLWRLYATPDRG